MSKIPSKTNAVRILEARGIAFELREYEWNETDLSATAVAMQVGMPLEQVFKTLVVRGDSGEIYMAVIPGNAELDLKAIARTAGERKVDPVSVKELEELTGYIRGGVSAIGAKREFPVILEELAQLFDVISVSGGRRGLQVLLAPGDYRKVTGASFADVSRFS
jgi:Cys-tRNA(Pro)/Cys-tRNA(Cys) deacylase